MRRLSWNRKGQTTLEYALLIAVVVGGLFAIQTYLGRGLKGRVRSSIDSIGGQYSAGNMESRRTIDVQTAQTNIEQFGIDSKGISYSESTGGRTDTKFDEDVLIGLSGEDLLD